MLKKAKNRHKQNFEDEASHMLLKMRTLKKSLSDLSLQFDTAVQSPS